MDLTKCAWVELAKKVAFWPSMDENVLGFKALNSFLDLLSLLNVQF